MNSSPPQKRKAARGTDGFSNEQDTGVLSHVPPDGTSGNGQREHRGYFRVSEEAMRVIHRKLDEPSAVRNAQNVYVTFCRKANLRGRTTFEDRLVSVAQDAAMQYRETQRAVKLLEGIGLLRVQRRRITGTKANAPSIYTIVTMLPQATTSEHEATTSWEDSVRGTSPQLSQEQIQSIHTNNI